MIDETMDNMDEEFADVDETSTDTIVEGYTGEKITSVLKAVKKHCLDCCAYQRDEVKLCPSTRCTLWPFRFGKNPYRKKKEYTEEQLEALRKRMSAGRNKS